MVFVQLSSVRWTLFYVCALCNEKFLLLFFLSSEWFILTFLRKYRSTVIISCFYAFWTMWIDIKAVYFQLIRRGGGCQLTQILCIKFTSFLNSLCTIALFTSFWVTCSIFSVTNECCALIYSVDCKPFYVQIENNFFFCMVYYCVSFYLLRDASNVFSFSHLHTNIHLIWIKLEETLSMFICPIIKFYFIKVADIFDKECSIMCNKYIK